jgi:signal transduction histidine kinase
MFRNANFGSRITLSVSLLLLGLLFSGVATYVYVESRGIDRDIRNRADHVLGFLESIHTQTMLNRGDKKLNNPVLDTLILDVSKVEAGAMKLIVEDLNMEEVIRDAVRVVKGRADDGGIDLSVSVARSFPRLLADSVRIKQIFLNLLSNAIKFTPEKGSVRIETKIEKDGCMARSVIDTGIGISEHELEKIVEPFAQASSGLARRHEGTGLGLYLVKSLVEEHGGSMTIDSRLGRGTVVTIRLPAERVLPVADETPPKAILKGAGRPD